MKRILKWAAIVLGSLVLLFVLVVGLFLGWLRWSGEREWKQAEAELRAKGEKLTFAELVPPMPPDSENFYADPLWAEYVDLVKKKNAQGLVDWEPRLPCDQRQLRRWESVPLTPEEKERLSKLIVGEKGIKTRKEAFSLLRTKLAKEKDPQKQKEMATLFLDIIAPAQPVLARIAKLSERPKAQFPIRYDLGLNAPLPHLTTIMVLSRIINGKALSELFLGKTQEATTDTLTLLRLASIDRTPPLLICHLVGFSSATMACVSINKGVELHAWTNDQLTSFQKLLGSIDLRARCLFALRGERIFFNEIKPCDHLIVSNGDGGKSGFENITNLANKIILLNNKAYQLLLIQRQLETLSANYQKGWNISSTPPMDMQIQDILKNPNSKLIHMLNVLSVTGYADYTEKIADYQTQVDQTLIACALERYRLAHGAYPASIDTLVPEYLAKLPNSPITGKPMNYSLKPDGTFLLWSPGWNLKSLGGKPGEFKGDGDIVWGMPVPMQDRPKASSTHN
jgi:hypothetical protein